MYKFGATFYSQKQQGLRPQAASFKRADEAQNTFLVAHQFKLNSEGKPLWAFGSYKNLQSFLECTKYVPATECFFFEQIRDGTSCWEYYDLEWDPSKTEDTEETIFSDFLQQRNAFCLEYEVLASECRILSASNAEKGSMHIILSGSGFKFRDNTCHMKNFMDAFHLMVKEHPLSKHIDWIVYTKNRNFRCINSAKRHDPTRVLRPAIWHNASCSAPESEFFVTNVSADATDIVHCHLAASKGARNKVPQVQGSEQDQDQEQNEKLPPSVIKAINTMLANMDCLSQFKIGESHNNRMHLKRIRSGHCQICNRIHDNDNAYVTIADQGKVYLHCYRVDANSRRDGLQIGKLDFPSMIALRVHRAQTNQEETITANKHCSLRHLEYKKVMKLLQNQKQSLVIRSEPDTAKTSFVESFMDRHKNLAYIFVSPRQSLARNLEKRLELRSYLSFPGPVSGKRVIIQAESLYKLDLEYYSMDVVLVLDEVCSIFEQMTSVGTMKGRHGANNQVLEELMRKSKRVIALDADVTDREAEIIKSVRSDVFVIHNTFKPQQGHQVVCFQHKEVLESHVIDLVKSGHKVWISTTHSAEDAETLHKTLQKMGRRGVCITKNTSDADKIGISQNINKIVLDLDYFIHTPTITVGIDCNVKHFNYVVGFFEAQTGVIVETCRQMLRRPRNVSTQKYLIYIKNVTSNLPTTFREIVEYMESQEVRLNGCELDISGFPYISQMGQPPSVDLKVLYALIYMQTLIKKHLTKNDFYQRFIDQMVQVGCSVQEADSHLCKNDEYTVELNQNKKELLHIKYTGISKARVLDTEEFSRLDVQNSRTQEEQYAVTKYKLMETYSVQDASLLTPDWVEKYDKPREKKIYKNLAMLKEDPTLQILRQEDRLGLKCGKATVGVHTLGNSRYLRFKYAKDILDSCGFDSPFDDREMSAEELKRKIDLRWSDLVKDGSMRDICTQLGIRCPSHNNWDFKNKKSFLNSVLNEIWGIHIVRTDHKSHHYYIKYMTEVGKHKDDFFMTQ
ncbi:hypothetical protein BX616_010754 [Lobosporangium transversale]|nr:hypothetical protein BX616_010754 [Lobosporangium transversale]